MGLGMHVTAGCTQPNTAPMRLKVAMMLKEDKDKQQIEDAGAHSGPLLRTWTHK